MFDTSQEVTKHMFELNGKYYPLDITTTKQNGKIKSQDVTYVSPKALDLLNINLKQYASVVTDMPDVPVEVLEQKVVGFNSIKIPKDEFSLRTGSDITTTNPVQLSSEEATLKVGQAFKSLREDYLKYYTQVLKETPDAYDAEKELYNIPKTLEGGALAIALANINMSEINGIESLVTNRMNFDKSMAMQIKAGEDNIQSVIEKYFPNFMSPSKPGDTTLNQFILENITSENLITLRDGNETEKKAAIAKLKNALVTDVEDATDRNIIADEIDLILTAVIQGNGFITIDQLQKQEGTMSEITGRVSDELQTWLDANKVALPAEINLADEGYDVEDMVGYQIKRAQNEVFIRNNPDHNPETGLKLFVNPNLKPNHVEPRPRRQFFKGLPEPRGGFEDWNRLWGKTHNPDGTPK